MKEKEAQQPEPSGSTLWWATGVIAGLSAAAWIIGRRAMQRAKPTAEQIVSKAESLVSMLEHSLPDRHVA
jgi:hypothetical protein